MGILTAFFLILLSGIFDRLRGTGKYVLGHAWAGVQGALIAYLLGARGWFIPSFAAFWWLGASFGWGNPVGAVLDRIKQNPNNREWWQVQGLQNPGNEVLSLFVRGAMWGACTIPVVLYFSGDPKLLVMAPIMAIIFPSAALLARAPSSSPVDYDTWAFMEFLRGTMAGIAAYLVGMIP